MDKLKESFARIQAWVKANPKKSAVIALVIVVIAYFAIKRGATESGASIDGGTLGQEDPGTGNAADLLGGLGSGGVVSDVSNPTPTTESILNDSSDSLSGGFDGGLDESDFGTFDNVPLPFFASSPAIAESTASIISGTNKMAQAMSKPIATPVSNPVTVATKAAVQAMNKPIATPVSKPVTVATKTTTQAMSKPIVTSVSKTAAEKAGLPRYFTGTSNGVIYALGAIVGYVKATATKSVKKIGSKPK